MKDSGMREGVTTDERDRIKILEREVQLNDIGPLTERRGQRAKGHGQLASHL